MFWQIFFTTFVTIFIAELGDKTQLATMLYAAKPDANKWAVFIGASGALVLTSAIGVLLASQMDRFISPDGLKWIAGLGFIGVGIWTISFK